MREKSSLAPLKRHPCRVKVRCSWFKAFQYLFWCKALVVWEGGKSANINTWFFICFWRFLSANIVLYISVSVIENPLPLSCKLFSVSRLCNHILIATSYFASTFEIWHLFQASALFLCSVINSQKKSAVMFSCFKGEFCTYKPMSTNPASVFGSITGY